MEEQADDEGVGRGIDKFINDTETLQLTYASNLEVMMSSCPSPILHRYLRRGGVCADMTTELQH
jgi:hypothetical protein